jgi:3-oxoacyl-[acyl-carrier protein] reductase
VSAPAAARRLRHETGSSSAGASEDPRINGCALVTGASRGIGAATARTLAADGWAVGINFRSDRDGAESVAGSIADDGGAAMAIGADVSDAAAADEMLGRLTDEHGPVLVLVNNAGLTADNLSMRLSDEEWSRVLDVNLTGAFRLTRAVLGPMMRQRFGRIVNVSSVVGLRANPGQANYAASKAGLIAFTRTVAAEVARRGVTVNAVAPGLIETELTRDFTGNGVEPTQDGSRSRAPSHQSALLDAIPARRTGTPEEVAACIRFLASEEAGYVTGTVLPIDGGMSA